MSKKLLERISDYQLITDCKILPKIPIIICINGRGFSKATQLLDKPYCDKFAECMLSTTLRLCSYVEGAIFGYQYNDEIVIIARNDQNNDTETWYQNRVQKISSIVASAATLYFNEAVSTLGVHLTGDALFTAQVFGVPTQAEAINTLICHQQHNFHYSVQSACLYNLLNKYDKHHIKEMLSGLDLDGKISLLQQECNINFNDYPLAFRRGCGAYKRPIIADDIMKNKWIIDSNLPIFTREQSFLSNLIKNNGIDIFREEGLHS